MGKDGRISRATQTRLRKYIGSKTDVEVDFIMSLCEERIDYNEHHDKEMEEIIADMERYPGKYKNHYSAIVTLEREREKLKKKHNYGN